MLLSYDSDTLNKFENYIKDYIQINLTKLLQNNQYLIFVKYSCRKQNFIRIYCHLSMIMLYFLVSPDSSVGRAVD
jgi:hypothetical protein